MGRMVDAAGIYYATWMVWVNGLIAPCMGSGLVFIWLRRTGGRRGVAKVARDYIYLWALEPEAIIPYWCCRTRVLSNRAKACIFLC